MLNPVNKVDFFFDPMCPWAYQTSLWIREVRRLTGLEINWRFFSLEEVNRPEGKPHPWERPLAYGWSPLRVAARLRRRDMALCDAWYAACGKALHTDGRKPHDPAVAKELLESIGASADDWDLAAALESCARAAMTAGDLTITANGTISQEAGSTINVSGGTTTLTSTGGLGNDTLTGSSTGSDLYIWRAGAGKYKNRGHKNER